MLRHSNAKIKLRRLGTEYGTPTKAKIQGAYEFCPGQRAHIKESEFEVSQHAIYESFGVKDRTGSTIFTFFRLAMRYRVCGMWKTIDQYIAIRFWWGVTGQGSLRHGVSSVANSLGDGYTASVCTMYSIPLLQIRIWLPQIDREREINIYHFRFQRRRTEIKCSTYWYSCTVEELQLV